MAKTLREYQTNIIFNGKMDKSTLVAANLMSDAIRKVASEAIKYAKEAFDTYKEYESSLTRTASIATKAGQSYTQIYSELNEVAREAGRTTIFSASEAADALGYMALAGWNTEQSTQALTDVLKLSTAIQGDLAITTDEVVASMGAMGLEVKDIPKYFDVLISAQNNSKLTAEQLMIALQGAGGALNLTHTSLEDAATAMGILANRGIEASEAGTLVNSMLSRMVGNSEAINQYKAIGVALYDSTGALREYHDIMLDVANATDKMSDAEKDEIFYNLSGVRAMSKYQYILDAVRETTDEATGQATSEWIELNKAIKEGSGSLETMYSRQMETLDSKLKISNSLIQEVQLSFMEAFGPMAAEAIDKLNTDVLPKLDKHMDEFAIWLAENPETVEGFLNATIGLITDLGGGIEILLGILTGDWVLAWKGAETVAIGSINAINGAAKGLSEIVVNLIDQLMLLAGLEFNKDVFNAEGKDIITNTNGESFWRKADGTIEKLDNGAWVSTNDEIYSDTGDSAFGYVSDYKLSQDTINNAAAKRQAYYERVTPEGSIDRKITMLAGGDYTPFASGGIVTAPTLGIIGEGKESEAVLPLSKLDAILESRTAGGGVTYAPNVVINGNASRDDISRALNEGYEKFKAYMDKYSKERKRLAFG